MKLRFLTVLNTAAASAVNVLQSVINDLSSQPAGAETWQRMVEFGEYPATVTINGREQEVVQVIDRQAGELMAENHATVINAIRHLGRGLPIFVGHPDNKGWLKENPGADESAKGRIKSIEVRDDGIYMLTAFNDAGAALLGGEAPAYSAHSPNWDMLPVAPGSKRYRPYVLRSIGLTNRPNISSCVVGLNMAGSGDSPSEPAGAGEEPENQTDNEMKLTAEALTALGFAPDATPTPEEISAAVVKMLAEKTTAESAVTAANTRATTAQTELTNLRQNLVDGAIATAVNSGRITEAQKPQWEGLLKADFANASAALANLSPVTGLNTRNQLGDLGERKGEGQPEAPGNAITAINSAVTAYAKEHSLDLAKADDYDRAFAAVKTAKPELFAKK